VYEFLLKAHEDLRQDERVMQLFALVNRLFREDYTARQQRLGIQAGFYQGFIVTSIISLLNSALGLDLLCPSARCEPGPHRVGSGL
jgi:hypothetical protein